MSILKKILAVIIITIMAGGVFYGISKSKISSAQTTSTDIEGIDESKYPGIKEALQSLKEQYPNWEFKILYTGLDWNDVISNEYYHTSGASSPRNLVQVTYSYNNGDWVCEICGENTRYDSGSWCCASEDAIAYMMDPRNSLNASDIFQFEELTINGCDISTIESMVKGTFLEGHANEIANSANSTGINPYYIVARLIQEQGTSGSATSSGASGYYNPFNIGATGNSSSAIIENAINYARNNGWDTLEKGITGGINYIASSYINKGQNTLYLQKFDVDDSDGSLYWHQYMQNLTAAQTEGTTLRNTYSSTNSISSSHTFIIPVYENMPVSKCARPTSTDGNTTYTEFGVQYISHIQDTGWETSQNHDSITSGTTGQNKKIEAMQISLVNAPTGVSIKYRSYVDGIGWQDAVENGETSGTTGQNKKMYAIRISLENTDEYSIMYRVHLEDEGWTDWVYDGAIAGSVTENLKIEAVQIKVVSKVNSDVSLSYNSHVQDVGWQGYVSAEETSGQINKKIEAIQMNLTNVSADTSIKYSMYVDGIGWQEEKQDGEVAGTVDQNKKVYGIKIETTNTEGYSLQYRVYVRDRGWQDWVSETQVAGLVDEELRIEAIEIRFVECMSVTYSSHVEDTGWQDYVSSGEISGTIGENKKVEAVKIKLNSAVQGASIEYSTYVETSGWQDYVSDDEISGTTGKSEKLYGIKIRLNNADGYTVQYRVHVQDEGWLDWVYDGEIAGDLDSMLKIEAIQVKVIKEETIIVSGSNTDEDIDEGNNDDDVVVEPELEEFSVMYMSHVQDLGWEETWTANGETSGTTGQNKKVEAIQIKLANAPTGASIQYRAYVDGIGWQDAVEDGETAGTTGKNKKMYAIRVSLENVDNYSIKYRVHLQDEGWTDWVYDGEIAGSVTENLKIEAIELELIENTSKSTTPTVQYISHVQSYGWETEWSENKEISGTVGKNKKIEAMYIKLKNVSAEASITYSMNIDGVGWKEGQDAELVGTTGQNKKVYGIKINLENLDGYRVKYRVHVQDVGWLDWVYDGELAGLETQNKKIEAIQIKLIKTTEKEMSVEYISHVQDLGWETQWVASGNTSGTTGQNKKIEAMQIKLVNAISGASIKYSLNVEGSGWIEAADGETAGTTGQNLKVYGIKINLENASGYTVKYRVHVQDVGWLDWVENGELAGLETQNKKIEAIEIKIQED